MKADRLLSALLLLQAYGKLPGRELAQRLDVSIRTVHRDMEALSAAGVPIFALRGSQGGWQLDENWRTRVPGLDEGELRALLMAQPSALGHPGLAAVAERALTKLLAAMPMTLRERASAIRQRLYVDATGWRGTVEDLSALPIVQEALLVDRALRIRYRARDRDRTLRTIEPLGLVAKGAIWYLVANTAGGFRTYRVSRIEEAAMLDSRFERPSDFDLAAYWKASAERLQQQNRYLTTLRLDPSAAESVRTWCQVLPTNQGMRPDENGWITLRVQFDDESEARFIVLGFGSQVEVIEPDRLRDRVAAEVERMCARQADHRISPTGQSMARRRTNG